MSMIWLLHMLVSASVQRVMSSGAGRHSLWLLATYISGPTQFPDFSAVLMLDDVQVGYYEAHMDELLSSSKETQLAVDKNDVKVIRDVYHSMRFRLAHMTHLFNLTKGIHVQQRIAGCEIQDGEPTFILSCDGFDGQDTEGLMYNTTHFSYKIRDGMDVRWDTIKSQFVQTLYQKVYLPVCVRVLKQLMDQNKNLVTRRVRPRLRIFSRQVKGKALVTCLATDFYPRHINLTMFRDTHEVEEDQLTSGPVLPNANGLYQVRKTLVLTDEELLQKHNYTCAATHLSLDNRLQVSWRAKSYHSKRAHFIPPIVLVTVVLLVLALVLVKCRKPRDTGGHRDLQKAERVAMVTESTEASSSTDQPPEDGL